MNEREVRTVECSEEEMSREVISIPRLHFVSFSSFFHQEKKKKKKRRRILISSLYSITQRFTNLITDTISFLLPFAFIPFSLQSQHFRCRCILLGSLDLTHTSAIVCSNDQINSDSKIHLQKEVSEKEGKKRWFYRVSYSLFFWSIVTFIFSANFRTLFYHLFLNDLSLLSGTICFKKLTKEQFFSHTGWCEEKRRNE